METSISPYQCIRDLKDLLMAEKEKLAINKRLTIQVQDFEMAGIYQEIEKKLEAFLAIL